MNVFELFAKLSLDDSEFKDKLSSAKSGLATFAKVGVTAAGAMAAGTAVVTGTLVKQTAQVAEYGDNIDKMSQKLGISATAYQEWDAILQHSGASIESLKAPMKTLAKQAQSGAEEFQKLGISQQEAATLSQEDLFARVITGLQGMEEGTERTAIASKLLGKGAVEMGALLNTSAEDTESMRQAVHDLGGVMSDEAVKNAAAFQDQLQDMQTGFAGLKRSMLSEFMPSLTTVMKGMTSMFSGNFDEGLETISKGIDDFISNMTNVLPQALQAGAGIMGALASAIVQNVPKLAKAGTDIILGLVNSIVGAIPNIANSAVEVIMAFVNGISGALPDLVPAAVEAVMALADGLISALPQMVEAAGQLIIGLATGIMNALPILIQEAPAVIGKFVGEIVKSLPQLISVAGQLIVALAEGLVSAIPQLIMVVPSMIEGLINAFTEFDWATFGNTVVTMISTGLSNAAALIHSAAVTVARMAVTAFRSIDWAGLGRSVISFIRNGVSTLASAIPSILRTIGSTAMNAFRSIPWSSVGAAVINFILSGLRALGSTIGSTLRSLGTSAMNAFKSISWSSLGTNVINGIVNGIRNGASRVVDAAKNLAKNAFDAAKNFLGIQSPSKLFRDKIGKMMALGMAIGFEQNMPLKQIQNAIDNTVNALSTKAMIGADMFSNALDADYGYGGVDTYSVDVEDDARTSDRRYGDIIINVYPSEGQDERAIADMVANRLADVYRRRRMSYA